MPGMDSMILIWCYREDLCQHRNMREWWYLFSMVCVGELGREYRLEIEITLFNLAYKVDVTVKKLSI